MSALHTLLFKSIIVCTYCSFLKADPIGLAKYAVSIQHKGIHSCTGSIVKPKVILTAASCFSEDVDVDDVKVYGGSSFRIIDNNSTAVKYEVDKMIVHPKYNPRDHNADIALLILTEEVDKNKNMECIDLSSNELKPDEECTLNGWIELFNGGPTTNELHAIHLTVLDHERCATNPFYNRQQACLMNDKGVGERSSRGEILICDGKQGGVGEFRLGVTPIFLVVDVSKFRKWIIDNGSIMSNAALIPTLLTIMVGSAFEKCLSLCF